MNSDKNIINTLAMIPYGAKIEKCIEHKSAVEIFISWPEPVGDERICPSCSGTYCVKKDAGTTQTVRHLPTAFSGCLVTFHKPRFQCKDCGKSFYMKPKWVSPDISVTNFLFVAVYEKLCSSSLSVAQIARDTFTSPAIINNIIRHIDLSPSKTLPVSLGIDEFHGSTGVYNRERRRYDTEKYHCVITDTDKGIVIDILYKATYRYLHDYFMKYPVYERRKVRFFCADMRSGFSKVAHVCFPNAKICIDPFHVVKLITSAISEIRIDEWRRLRQLWHDAWLERKNRTDPEQIRALKKTVRKLESDYLLVKNSQKLLVTSPYNSNAYWNVKDELREERLEQIKALSPMLIFAHKALMEFYDIASYDEFRFRHKGLSEWLEKYLACDCSAVRRAAHSINFHRTGIENAWRYGKSNSPTEGLNKKIKDCKRLAFGAHSFENFRKRALLACGGKTFVRHSYTVGTETKSEGEELYIPASTQPRKEN